MAGAARLRGRGIRRRVHSPHRPHWF
jgi:hypothetical protein